MEVKSQKKITLLNTEPNASLFKHQEIVFQQTKFIFYDVYEEKVKAKLSQIDMNKISKHKTFSRPQTGMEGGCRSHRKENNKTHCMNTCSSSTRNKYIENSKISQLSNQMNKGSSVYRSSIQKERQRISTRRSKVGQELGSVCSNNEACQIEPMGQETEEQRINSHEASAINNIPERTIEEQEILQFKEENKNEINDENLPKSESEIIANSKLCEEKSEECHQEFFKKDTYKRMDIRELFGRIHLLLEPNSDFISNLGKDELFFVEVIKGSTEKELEEEILVLNHQQDKLKANKEKTEAKEESNYSGFFPNYSHLIAGSIHLERAPILSYIKSSYMRNLFNIVISEPVSSNENFIDIEFEKSNFPEINGEKSLWTYIEPKTATNLFSKTKKYSNKSSLPWIIFLTSLYEQSPEIITRIFEPCIANVFSVWLFVHGCFEPIFVDGYFPLNNELEHVYTGSQEIWLNVIVKAICKAKNSYKKEDLEKISCNQIYHLLTGIDLTNPSTLSNSLLNSSIWINTKSGELSLLKKEKSENWMVLEEFGNWFIYRLDLGQGLREVEIKCWRDTEVILSACDIIHGTFEEKELCLYQFVESKSKVKKNKAKLLLRNQSKFSTNWRYLLKKGTYKIFIGTKKNSMEEVFLSPNGTQENLLPEDLLTTMSLLTSQEIKLSKSSEVQKKGREISDNRSFYKNRKYESYEEKEVL